MSDNIGLENIRHEANNLWRINDGFVTEEIVRDFVYNKMSLTLTVAQLAEAIRGPEYFTNVVAEAADILEKEPELVDNNFEPEYLVEGSVEEEEQPFALHLTVMEGGESLTLSRPLSDTSVSSIRKSVDKIFERFDSIEANAVITIVIEER